MTSRMINSSNPDSAYISGGAMGYQTPFVTKAKDSCSGRSSHRPSHFGPDDPLPNADSIQMLQKENTSLKTSVQSIKVLKPLLTDRDKLINHLKQEMIEYKLGIEHLQSRLHKHKLDSSVDLQERELFIPGHDKEVLKDLLNETIRLRKMLDANYSSEEVAEAQKTIEDLREEVTRLSKKLTLTEKEFSDHLIDMKSSDNEKNAVISKLRGELRKYYTQRAYDDDVRLTLSGEVGQLKLKMEILVMEMGNMAKELKDYEQMEKVWEEDKKFLEKQEMFQMQNDSGLSLEDECKSLKDQAKNLKRENVDLSKQLKEVISMNTRWQKYSDQREAYVVQLTEKNQMKISENKVLDSKCQELLRKLDGLDRMLKKKDSERKDEIDAVVMSLEADLGKYQDENIKLHQKVETLEKVQQQRPPSPEHSERIMLLEHQVKSLTEDFELERKDRTNLQTRYQQLYEKNNQLTNIITQQNQGSYHQISPLRTQNQQQPRFNPYKMENTCAFDQAPNIKGYLPPDVEVDGGKGHDYCDFGQHSQSSRTSPRQMQAGRETAGIHGDDNTDGSLGEDAQLLHCPRCFKGFTVMEHALLIDHVDTCDGNGDDIEIG